MSPSLSHTRTGSGVSPPRTRESGDRNSRERRCETRPTHPRNESRRTPSGSSVCQEVHGSSSRPFPVRHGFRRKENLDSREWDSVALPSAHGASEVPWGPPAGLTHPPTGTGLSGSGTPSAAGVLSGDESETRGFSSGPMGRAPRSHGEGRPGKTSDPGHLPRDLPASHAPGRPKTKTPVPTMVGRGFCWLVVH